jgi:hypothetical protein
MDLVEMSFRKRPPKCFSMCQGLRLGLEDDEFTFVNVWCVCLFGSHCSGKQVHCGDNQELHGRKLICC